MNVNHCKDYNLMIYFSAFDNVKSGGKTKISLPSEAQQDKFKVNWKEGKTIF